MSRRSLDSDTDGRDLARLDPRAAQALPERVEAWLSQLEDLSLWCVPGKDPDRLRIVSTLLHGNEPSSIRALHRWLRTGQTPATQTWVLVGAVRAAQSASPTGLRFLPADGDLNRCWRSPFETARARRVEALLQQFAGSGAEALLDLHNNTGHNPAYGVGPRADAAVLALTSLFGDRFVCSPLAMGTLVEATAPFYPSLTVECGRSGDPTADEVAYQGLSRFLALERIESLTPAAARVQILRDPIRVTVRPGTRLRFARRPDAQADLTLDPAIDRHNFQTLASGTPLGWSHAPILPLQAIDGAGRDRAGELFDLCDGELRVGAPWVPVMMTTDPHAALSDCLFYAVHGAGSTGT